MVDVMPICLGILEFNNPYIKDAVYVVCIIFWKSLRSISTHEKALRFITSDSWRRKILHIDTRGLSVMIAVIGRVKTNICSTIETISIYVQRNKIYIYRVASRL
jgi:hypothetical protein